MVGHYAHRAPGLDLLDYLPKQLETHTRRIKNACCMLAAGKRRVCCFDRSGFYSKSLSAPTAAV